MPILTVEQYPLATDIYFDEFTLRVALSGRREIAASLEWFPKLRDAMPRQRENWRLIGKGEGIHWPDLDEDISVSGRLGNPA